MCQFALLAVVLPLLVANIASWLPVGLAVRVLVSANMEVKATQYLNVSGCYLVMQPDCNVVLYDRSQPLLSTGTASAQHEGNCTAVMEDAGNFFIYETYANLTRHVIYNSSMGTAYAIKTFSYLLLRGNGTHNFFDYNSRQMIGEGFLFPFNSSLGTPPSVGIPNNSEVPNMAYPFPPELAWKPTMSLDGFPYMPAEYFLSQGSKLQTVDQRFVLTLGSDCNLQNKLIWADGSDYVLWQSGSNTTEVRSCQLMLQQDGRLEIRNNVSGVVYWNSNVTGNVSVGWVLRLRSSDYGGYITIEDIEDAYNVLWTTNNLTQSTYSVVWIWIGLIVGVCVLAMAVLALVCCNCVRTRKGKILDPAEKAFRRRLEERGGNSQTRYSKAKIKQATNNFGNSIGCGGFGDVFHGKLPDGQEIAAKVLSAESHQSKQEFFNEIELLSVVHHKNLVSLLGYRCTKKQQILVYEYMSGGDLRHRLQGQSAAENPLSWRQRTSIALQVAEGLEYLHDKCSPSIIHRDVKSTNILLSDKLEAKVADFGLSKLRTRGQEDATHVTTVVKGTPGYLDPEYHETGMLTEKSDVYAFGIVLMEILTGQHQMYIAHRVAEAWRLEQFDDLPDPNLRGEYDTDEFGSLVELSLWCSRRSSSERPFMRQVVQRLRDLGLAPPEPPQPDIILGDEGQQVMVIDMDIENSEDFAGDTLPLSQSYNNY